MRISGKTFPLLRLLLCTSLLGLHATGCTGPLDSFDGDGGYPYPDASAPMDGSAGDASSPGDAGTDPGSVLIKVVDLDGQPVVDVTVFLDDVAQGTTDSLGLFCAQDLPTGQPLLVRTTSDGCSTATRFAHVAPNSVTIVTLTCVAVNVVQLADAVVGGAVQGPGGFDLQLPPGSLHLDGDPVVGSVDVRYAMVNSATAMAAAPGDMLSVEGGGDVVQLESFGMVEVTFYQGGQKLTFDGVNEAVLSFPLADSASYTHGQSLGLYSFDEQLGYWRQEGSGTVDTQTTGFPVFVAYVTHFSWWNADVPLSDKHCIAGRLVDDIGNPLSGADVRSAGVDYLGSASTVTDSFGSFCVNVKRDSLNDLIVWSIADGATYFWDAPNVQAGAVPTDCDLGSCVDLGDQTVQSSTALETCQ